MLDALLHLSDLQRLILAMLCLIGLLATAISLIDSEL
jgi:hypothetical protein